MKKINGSNPFGEKKGKTNKSKNAIGREKAHILCSLMRIFVIKSATYHNIVAD